MNDLNARVKVYPEQHMKTYFSPRGFHLGSETATSLECDLWEKLQEARGWVEALKLVAPEVFERHQDLLPEWLK